MKFEGDNPLTLTQLQAWVQHGDIEQARTAANLRLEAIRTLPTEIDEAKLDSVALGKDSDVTVMQWEIEKSLLLKEIAELESFLHSLQA